MLTLLYNFVTITMYFCNPNGGSRFSSPYPVPRTPEKRGYGGIGDGVWGKCKSNREGRIF
jgi:hypothetical protein